MDSFQINSPTNMTLNHQEYWRHVYHSHLIYYVKDSYGDLSGNSQWSGPTMSPNQVVSANFIIDGQAFTFHSGTSYTVEVVSSRNNQFTFTIDA